VGSGSIGGNTAKSIPKGSGENVEVSVQSYDTVLEVLNGRQREYI